MINEVRIGGTTKTIWETADEPSDEETLKKFRKEVEETDLGQAVMRAGFEFSDNEIEDDMDNVMACSITYNKE